MSDMIRKLLDQVYRPRKPDPYPGDMPSVDYTTDLAQERFPAEAMNLEIAQSPLNGQYYEVDEPPKPKKMTQSVKGGRRTGYAGVQHRQGK